MKALFTKLTLSLALLFPAVRTCGQGTFQNLDFENGMFIPIPGDPFGRVQFGPAMPGWTGFLGTNQINWILHNNIFLGDAGMAINGPDQLPGEFHDHYYIVLQNSFPPSSATVPSLVQSGVIPADAMSLRFVTGDAFAVGFSAFFAGQAIPLSKIGQSGQLTYIWGGDISAFAGQVGELRFRGNGYLDFIQFSNQPIPEPGVIGLFAVGALLLGWRLRRHATQ